MDSHLSVYNVHSMSMLPSVSRMHLASDSISWCEPLQSIAELTTSCGVDDESVDCRSMKSCLTHNYELISLRLNGLV